MAVGFHAPNLAERSLGFGFLITSTCRFEKQDGGGSISYMCRFSRSSYPLLDSVNIVQFIQRHFQLGDDLFCCEKIDAPEIVLMIEGDQGVLQGHQSLRYLLQRLNLLKAL